MSDEPQAASGEEGPSYYQPTTTPEAQKYARTILDKQIGGGNQKGEAAILDEMKQNSQRAIQALRQAQQSMAGVQYDPRPNQANVAAALLAPTRSGSTSEGLGKAFEAYGSGIQGQRNFELERLKALLGYQQQIAEKPDELTKTKLELQKLHEQQEGPLGKEALTVLGRSIVPGSGMLSNFDKIAAGEGYPVGTPQHTARVRFLVAQDLKNKAATAGTDSDSYTEPDHSDAAYKYGVPTEAPYPWEGASTKERKQALQTERVSSNKMLNELQSHMDQAQQIQRDLDRFGYLNKRTATSSVQGVPWIHFLTGFGEDSKEMDKISSRLGPMMRQPGMGRMTNLDLNTFMASTVGRDKPMAVNDSIRTAMGTAITNQTDYNNFMHSYFAVHKTLQGAPEAWYGYLLKNPIFDPLAPEGSFKLNKGRTDYKTYFRSLTPQGHDPAGGAPSQFPDVTEADRNDPTFTGMSDEEIHGAKIPAKARGGPIRGYAKGGKVKPEDDYKATLEDLARSLEQGASFQWGDELNSSVSPGPYSQNVQSERGQQERFAGSHPWSNVGLEAAGGMGSSMAAAKLTKMALEHAKGKAGALGAAASLASRLMPRNALLKAGVVGAGAGAVSGAGSAQDVESIPRMATEQGLIGAGAGPLASLVTKYGVNGAMALIDKIRGRAVPAGAQKVLSALQGDRTTVDEIGSRLRASQRQGVPSMMSDVGGPRVQALAQGVASKEGPNIQSWTDTLRARQGTSNTRVQDLVNRALKPDDYQTKLTELTTNLYNQAKPLYQQAYAQFPRVKSDAINTILATKFGKKAGKDAFALMQADGTPIGQADVTGMIRKPSLQYLDYVKRALDDQIEKATRSGSMNQARIIKNMRNGLRDELDAATDDGTGNSLYKQARKQYAGDMEVLDALKMGRDDMTGANGLTATQIRQKVANMSYAEKDALRTGVAESLFQKVGNTPLSNNAATPIANIPNMQEKLSAMFDKPGDYLSFMQGLTREMQNFNQAKNLLSTQSRSAAAGASADLEPTGKLGEAAYEGTLAAAGHPLWAGARLAKQAGNAMMGNPTADKAAELLAIQGNPAGRTQLDMLKAQAAQLAARQGSGEAAGLGAAGATGPVLAPDPWGNMESP